MARYTGPKIKISRREGMDIFDAPKWNKRNFPPGMHGPKKSRQTRSNFGKQLREKQRARFMYGLMERQFRNTFLKAQQLTGDVAENLLKLLECRLDNAVYRAGLAKTRRLARQLVSHGHIMVNDRRTDIPSFQVSIGDVISVKPSKLKTTYWTAKMAELAKAKQPTPAWLQIDPKKMSLTVTAQPRLEEMPQNLETKLIVEFYSR